MRLKARFRGANATGCFARSATLPSAASNASFASSLASFNLAFVDIPEGISTIRKSAFYGCFKLRFVSLPKSLTSIGARTFAKCGSLRRVDAKHSKLRSIGGGAFSGCFEVRSGEERGDELTRCVYGISIYEPAGVKRRCCRLRHRF